MKTLLKVLGVLASLVVILLGWSYVRYLQNPYRYCTVTLAGAISPETFVQNRECLVRSEAPRKTFLVQMSPGGDAATALALGILIHNHGWDVEIVDHCLSSCANFIFPAGKTIYLHRQTMLAFHGGPHQQNMLEQAETADRIAAMNGARAEFVTLPQAHAVAARTEFVTIGPIHKEGTVSTTPITPAYLEVQRFLSIPEKSTHVKGLIALRKAAEQFYRELGVNLLLPTYGQLGVYEPAYKSYVQEGFLYRLDSLRRLGVANIQLKDGEWHPDKHFYYPNVYEVTYP